MTDEAQWFAAWMPKAEQKIEVATVAADPRPRPAPSLGIGQVRAELEAVCRHLTDPSADGVRAAIPHLERAVDVFKSQVQPAAADKGSASVVLAGVHAIRSELASATRLFENAYQFHSDWATQLGIHLDGTPRQLLYSRPSARVLESAAGSSWEG
ncbi:MAG TPA: hypothetical protein VGL53_21115 [Bryobacteraceae bacterium]|jgi:hypothetical protein